MLFARFNPDQRNVRCRRATGLVAAAGLALAWSAPAARGAEPADPAQFVNPLIGTAPGSGQVGFNAKTGDVFPGAVFPRGLLQWSPDTPSKLPGGYYYPDRTIKGFSVRHFSGRGCVAWQDIAFMPCAGRIDTAPSSANGFHGSTFSHDHETAGPGDYRVQLDNGVQVELTATARTGLAQFTFPAGAEGTVLINAGSSATGATADTGLTVVGAHRIQGRATARVGCGKELYTLYFSAEFDRAFERFSTWSGDAVTAGLATTSGARSGVILVFETSAERTVKAKVGLSFVSVENAEANLRAENSSWNLTGVRAAARAAWDKVLNQIEIAGGTAGQRETFYTALYHCFLHPNIFNDVNGQYRGMDGKVHVVSAGRNQYENITAWDSCRSEMPLLALLAPVETSDILQSLVTDAQQGGGGLPRWVQGNRNSGGMIGDGPVVLLASGYAFGATGFDTAGALAAMDANAGKAGTTSDGHPVRAGLDEYLSRGYVLRSVAVNLDYVTADFALSRFAQSMGDEAKATAYFGRSGNWRKLYNLATGLIQMRNPDGSWVANVTPATRKGYTEGNAEQYVWTVPFDLRGLIDRMGGNAAAVARLDRFFSKLNDSWDSPYAFMGNEPDEDVPWAYDYAGAPAKTQDVVRRIQAQLFTAAPNGLPGNDDGGALSSWYVFSALGLYPSVPGVGGFVLGSPLFSRATVHLKNGRDLVIRGINASVPNRYVQGLTVNGASATKLWLPFDAVRRGGELEFTLGDRPSDWGTAALDAPPSYPSPAGPGSPP